MSKKEEKEQKRFLNNPKIISSYLNKVTINKAIDNYRKTNRNKEEPLDDDFDSIIEENPISLKEHILKNPEPFLSILKVKLKSKELKKKHYLLIKYSLMDKLTDEDIRKELNIPTPNAYRAFKSRTLKKIRELPDIQHYIQKIYGQ